MGSQGGGVLVKVLVTVLVLALATSGAGFVLLKGLEPLTAGEVSVGTNELAIGSRSDANLRAGGEVYVATVIRNAGRFPLVLQGVGSLDGFMQLPYVPAELRLGDGETTDLEASASFTPTRLDPGTGIGILLVFRPNPELPCELFTDGRGSGFEYRTLPLRFTVYGVESSQELDLEEGLFSVARPSREACEQATGG